MDAPTLRRRPDGIAVLRFPAGVQLTLELAELASGLVREELSQQPAPLLIDLRGVADATLDSNLVAPAQQEGQVAILVDSFLLQLLSSEFIARNDDAVNRRLFRDEDLALDWLGSGTCASRSSPSSGSSTSRSTRSA